MVLQTGPLVSYAEMTVPLPASPVLWLASDAEQWKRLYCAQKAERPPTLAECVLAVDLLETNRGVVDMSMSCAAVVYALWGMVWEYRQMDQLMGCGSSSSSSSSNSCHWQSSLLMKSRYQQLTETLDQFGLGYQNESGLQLHITMMHLHMSLKEIQLLAVALEKPPTAGRIPTSMRTWARSRQGRRAVWHAGQVVRELKVLGPQCLRDFAAIALYHSTLALWAYGVGLGTPDAWPDDTSTVWLDAENSDMVRRFISLERGRPMLHAALAGGAAVDLRDPSALLAMALQLMRQNHNGPDARGPPAGGELGPFDGEAPRGDQQSCQV